MGVSGGAKVADAVAGGRDVALEVLEGITMRVKVGFFVGVPNGDDVCVGIDIGFDLVALAVSGAGEDELAVAEKTSVAKLAETEAGGDPRVRLKLIKAIATVMKRRLNPNSQRALRI